MTQPLTSPNCITVAQLKAWLADVPDTNAQGEPMLVVIEAEYANRLIMHEAYVLPDGVSLSALKH